MARESSPVFAPSSNGCVASACVLCSACLEHPYVQTSIRKTPANPNPIGNRRLVRGRKSCAAMTSVCKHGDVGMIAVCLTSRLFETLRVLFPKEQQIGCSHVIRTRHGGTLHSNVQ